ncbi:MAG: hypothetical protein IPK72_22065 [Candidatus Eisenbacteria bacterium]|nr:hypothetical protein [Candidatus Eisenbacteria bacterium]
MPESQIPSHDDEPNAEAERSTLELLDRWHAGDKAALLVLIERHAPWLKRYVGRQMTEKLRRFDTSEDVVQSILYNLLRYTPPSGPRTNVGFVH